MNAEVERKEAAWREVLGAGADAANVKKVHFLVQIEGE